MKIDKAFIETIDRHRMEPEMRDVYEELIRRNIPVEFFTEKRIRRRQLPITKDTLVVGYVATVLAALKHLGIQAPATNDYPRALTPYFHRSLWESTVGQLVEGVYSGNPPIFAKPKDQKKRFTGRVFGYPDDLSFLNGASKTTPLLCAEVVDWLSEYRVFVVRGEIVGIRHYAGDPSIAIDQQSVVDSVRILEQSRETTVAYAIDFGVISTGQTAVVEWNDGFSLGSYGLDKTVYTDLLIVRWCEITGC
jgi:hypothetical protein